MAGLTNVGFTPLSYDEIVTRIKGRLEAFSEGIDLSAESPDGQLVEIMSFELSQVWAELSQVYNSYNPSAASGAALRNIGMLTGLNFGAATLSQVDVDLVGTEGVVVPRGSIISDADGNQFSTSFNATIPSNVQAVALVAGPLDVSSGMVNTIVTAISGWDSVSNPSNGRSGQSAQTEISYRNLRNKTVLRNFTSVAGTIRARLLENLGIEQVLVLNNDSPIDPLPDGTPPNTLHVTVGEVASHITDLDIAQTILVTKGLGCTTYGSTTVEVLDAQGVTHSVSFSKAVAKDIFVDIEVLFLDEEYAGAENSIRTAIVNHINSLDTDEDVIWSRLFALITPYAKAQVNILELSTDGLSYSPTNISIGANEFASTQAGNISITVVN